MSTAGCLFRGHILCRLSRYGRWRYSQSVFFIMSSDEHHDKLSLDELIRQIDEEVLEEIKRRGEKGRPEFRYMAKDIVGYWYNAQYPPDTERYGTDFHGYPTDSHETFFYNFAVHGYYFIGAAHFIILISKYSQARHMTSVRRLAT